VAILFEHLNTTGNQARIEQCLLGKPDVEMDTELLKIITTIRQLLGQCMLVNVGPIRPSNALAFAIKASRC
jgi:hypothetical protein